MAEVVTVQNPPVLKGPSDKEKKYDRQLRLWAASGQQALEDAVILLINSGPGAVGIETLKNLVLPGIGKFIIYDESTVTEADLGVNFFLDEDCLGKSRAECCVKFLRELNPDVEGDWFPKEKGQDLEWMLYGRNPQNKEYALIIYTLPFDSRNQELLARANDRHQKPIIGVHSAGFYSYFRTYFPGAFPIVETHPDSTATTDLRLLTPWEELKNFAAGLTKDIETLTDHEHGHIPYVVLLLYYLEKWKEAHGSAPTTYKEKIAFREMVRAGARVDNAEGGEENFDEAFAAVLKTISAPTLSSNVKEVFAYRPYKENAPKTESGSPQKLKMKYEENYNSNFWVIVDAIKIFYAGHNSLPLPGSVPDMKAQSTVYVQLQNIYKAKARKDAAEVFRTVRAHPKGSEIDTAEVESFCKNAAFTKLIRGDLARGSHVLPEIAKSEFENDENGALTGAPFSLLPIYLALTSTSLGAKTSAEILESIEKWLPNASENTRLVEVAEEVARAKGGELHNISALTGGMVAQEAIKLITKQYIPIDNTCIFDGITSRTQVLRI